jgi:RNA polymerase sigma-70 factor (ECF subfamily)
LPPAEDALGKVHRAAASRVVAALAARFRDLDLAEEAYAEACLRAAGAWSDSPPGNAAAWLYRTATRVALDQLRRRAVRQRHAAAERPLLSEEEEEAGMLDPDLIPDERLRLIFVCCHPALAEEARVALTLKIVCRLDTAEIARAFLVPEPTLAQRLVRAKRKIAEAGVPFEIPGPQLWAERLDAVLSTLEIAFAKAHEDASGTGKHAGFASQVIELTQMLAELIPNEPDVLALAALVRFAEARRPARVDDSGCMVPLSEQNPRIWDRSLIASGDEYLKNALTSGRVTIRLLQAMIHAAWCRRISLAQPAPWPKILFLYDELLGLRADPIVRLNRAVALAEVNGPEVALAEVNSLDADAMRAFLPYHAVRADLLRRLARSEEAAQAYRRCLDLDPTPAEAAWLRHHLSAQSASSVSSDG